MNPANVMRGDHAQNLCGAKSHINFDLGYLCAIAIDRIGRTLAIVI